LKKAFLGWQILDALRAVPRRISWLIRLRGVCREPRRTEQRREEE